MSKNTCTVSGLGQFCGTKLSKTLQMLMSQRTIFVLWKRVLGSTFCHDIAITMISSSINNVRVGKNREPVLWRHNSEMV